MTRSITLLLILVVIAVWSPGVQAQDEKKLGWFLTGDVSWVGTSGNSDLSTIGFGGTLRRVWPRSVFSLKGNFIHQLYIVVALFQRPDAGLTHHGKSFR